jgi:patatin-related protein
LTARLACGILPTSLLRLARRHRAGAGRCGKKPKEAEMTTTLETPQKADVARAEPGKTKELRLAVVCYGGSSLAVYMHGVTKEINRLVRGSSLLEAGQQSAGTASEQVYARLLQELADKDNERVRTRVVVDVIAGTSAGGINGICLAKAIAHDLSLDALRDLWFEHGDIDGLLDAPRFLPRKLKFAWVATRALKHAPLRGELMARWIYDAFDQMDKRKQQEHDGLPTLLPDHHLLELFVTVTDFYGYGRQVPYADPNPIFDTRHRHLLTFRFGDGQDDFDGPSNGALAFAARTTSCIPGVFPPVSFDTFRGWLEPRPIDLSELERRYFRLYELAQYPPNWTWFVDGGVLDNKPFGPAIDAIRDRPAEVEVDRRLIYLEPDPGDTRKPSSQPAPGTLAAAIGGLTGLPRAEPILDDLVEVGRLNERVRRIRDIVQTSRDAIEQRVTEIAGPLQSIPQDPTDPQLADIRTRLHEEARRSAGFSYATYVRLKISGVIDRYAETVCAVCDLPDDSTHALLARSVIRNWAEREQLFDQQLDPTQRQLDFLTAFDLGYSERRLRFLIDCLNSWYDHVGEAGYPQRAEIDAAKKRLWDAVGKLRDAVTGTVFDDTLRTSYTTCFPVKAMTEFLAHSGFDSSSYVEQHAQELGALETSLKAYLKRELKDFTANLYGELLKLTSGWSLERRSELLLRYLGFPFWDILLYPVQAIDDVGERDQVEVIRISPRDTHRIPPPSQNGGQSKLVGAEEHHFGAFLSRPGRENDYLWGRLDGAERLIGILVENDADRERWCKEAFLAILDEDANAVPKAAELVAHVKATVNGGATH